MAKLEPGGREGVLSLVSLPRISLSPFKELARRTALALLILMLNTFIVWLDRDAYVDNTAGDGVQLLDALYYSTVTMTTTGYGDITPVAAHARLMNVLVVTPLPLLEEPNSCLKAQFLLQCSMRSDPCKRRMPHGCLTNLGK